MQHGRVAPCAQSRRTISGPGPGADCPVRGHHSLARIECCYSAADPVHKRRHRRHSNSFLKASQTRAGNVEIGLIPRKPLTSGIASHRRDRGLNPCSAHHRCEFQRPETSRVRPDRWPLRPHTDCAPQMLDRMVPVGLADHRFAGAEDAGNIPGRNPILKHQRRARVLEDMRCYLRAQSGHFASARPSAAQLRSQTLTVVFDHILCRMLPPPRQVRHETRRDRRWRAALVCFDRILWPAIKDPIVEIEPAA
jgi:hypothetical protein